MIFELRFTGFLTGEELEKQLPGIVWDRTRCTSHCCRPQVYRSPSSYTEHKSRGSLLLPTTPHPETEKLFVLCREFHFCFSRKGKFTAPWQLHSRSQGKFFVPSTCSCISLMVPTRNIQIWVCLRSLTSNSQDSKTHKKTQPKNKQIKKKNHDRKKSWLLIVES